MQGSGFGFQVWALEVITRARKGLRFRVQGLPPFLTALNDRCVGWSQGFGFGANPESRSYAV